MTVPIRGPFTSSREGTSRSFAAESTGRPRPRPGSPTNAQDQYSNVDGGIVGGVLQTTGAVARGVMRGVDETSNALVGVAGYVAEKTKLGHLIGGEDFKEWWAKPIRESNPLQFSRHLDWMHERSDGLLGVVESLSQFAVGMVGAGKLSRAAGAAKWASSGWRRFFLTSAEGMAADAVAFGGGADDGVAKPLSDLELMPSFVQGPMRAYVASRADDTEAEGRLKNALEGFVLGSVLEGTMAFARRLKEPLSDLRAARAADKAKLADDPLDDIADAAEGNDLYDVRPDPETGDALVIRKADGAVVSRSNSLNEAVDLANTRTWADLSAAKLVPDISPEVAKNLADLATIGDPSETGSLFASIRRLEFGLEAKAGDVLAWADELIAKHGEAFAVARSRWSPPEGMRPGQSANVESAEEFTNRALATARAEGQTDASLVAETFATGLDDVERARIRQAALAAALQGASRNLKIAARSLAKHPLDPEVAKTMATAMSRWLSIGTAHSAYGTAAGRLLRDRQNMARPASFLTGGGTMNRLNRAEKLNKAAERAIKEVDLAERALAAAREAGDEGGVKAAERTLARAQREATGALNNVEALTKRAAEREGARLNRQLRATEAEAKRILGDRKATLESAAEVLASGTFNRPITDPERVLANLGRLVKRAEDIKARKAALDNDAARELVQRATTMTEEEFAALAPDDPIRAAIEAVQRRQDRATGQLDAQVIGGMETIRRASPSLAQRLEAAGLTNNEAIRRIREGRLNEVRSDQDVSLRELMEVERTIREEMEQDINPFKGMTREDILFFSRTFSLTDAIDRPEVFERLAKVLHGVRESRLVEAKADPSFYDKLVKYRTQAMLLRVATHVVNTVGNLVTTLQVPAELALAGANEAVSGSLRGDLARVAAGRTYMAEAKDTFVGLGMAFSESWRQARLAFDIGGAVLDRMPGRFEELDTVGDDLLPWEGLHRALDFGSRLLVAEDEWFKQMAYRASLYADASRAAREAGRIGKDAAPYIADYFERSFFADQSAASLKGLDYARYSTFSRQMSTETRQKMLDLMSTGIGRWLFPFRKTPLNMMFFAAERTPGLARFMHEWKAAMASGDPRLIATAKAREQVGYAFYGTAAYLALSGNLTGRGPIDPEQRKRWLQAGFQPYSVRIGDTWFSYRRLENVNTPFQFVGDLVQQGVSALDQRTLLGEKSMTPTEAIGFYTGLVADMIHAQANTVDDRADDKFAQMAGATVLSFMATIADKALLTTASEFLETITSGDPNKMTRFMNDQVGTLVPGVLKEVFMDDHREEVQAFVWEGISRYTAFHGGESVRNILGVPTLRGPQTLLEEPDGTYIMDDASTPFVGRFSPFHMSPADGIDEDIVEFLKLGTSVAMPEDKDAEGWIDLRSRDLSTHGQSPYDRMGEIAQKGDGPLPPLRDLWRKLRTSEAYQLASAGSPTRPGGTRAEMARVLVQNYYSAAKARVLSDPRFAPYREQLEATMKEKGSLLMGDSF